MTRLVSRGVRPGADGYLLGVFARGGVRAEFDSVVAAGLGRSFHLLAAGEDNS